MKTCPSCGESLPARSPSPVVAAVLSFLIPGLGQMYRGDVATGFGEREYAEILHATLKMDGLIRQHGAIMDRYDPEKKLALAVDEK